MTVRVFDLVKFTTTQICTSYIVEPAGAVVGILNTQSAMGAYDTSSGPTFMRSLSTILCPKIGSRRAQARGGDFPFGHATPCICSVYDDSLRVD